MIAARVAVGVCARGKRRAGTVYNTNGDLVYGVGWTDAVLTATGMVTGLNWTDCGECFDLLDRTRISGDAVSQNWLIWVGNDTHW